MRRRVVITGMGAVSALGGTAEELWQGVLAGRSGVVRLDRMVAAGSKVTTGGEVALWPHDQVDRDVVMATHVIDRALDQAGIPAGECGFLWGPGLDTFQTAAGELVLRTGGACFAALAARHRRPRRMIAMACATGTSAIGEAFHLVRSGRVDCCVAGGSSVMLTMFYLTGFAALGAVASDIEGEHASRACRPFDRLRRGFALADGAAALIVEGRDRALARGARPLAEIVGFGTSADGFDLNRPPPDGAGALACMRAALADAGLTASDIDAVNAHGTGTFTGDLAEAAALREVLGERWPATPVSSVKGAIGHAMAAAGALEAVIAVYTCTTGVVPPTVNLDEIDEPCQLCHVIGEPLACDAARVLSTSFGMGGQNAALIVERLEP